MKYKTVRTVVCVDQHGNPLGLPERIPEPDRFMVDGLAQIESYVSRLLQSSANFASLIIGTPDEQTAVGLWQKEGAAEFSISIDVRSRPSQEGVIRRFFSERKLSAIRDHLAGNGGIPGATRCLGYVLLPDVKFITDLTKDVFQDVYGLRQKAALNFTYAERKKKA